jgi:hypothetical protein
MFRCRKSVFDGSHLMFSLSWIVLAAAASALTFFALVGTLLAIALLWRLRRDSRVIEAAERFEAVNLSDVVKRYVPTELQTQRSAEEIAVAKQVIAARRPRWKRVAVLCGLLLVCASAGASYSTREHLKVVAATPRTAKPRINLDVLKDVQGVWGWRADDAESCPENPQTITVTPDRKRLLVRYAKPYQDGSSTFSALDFDVVSATPDTLELWGPVSAAPSKPNPIKVLIRFLDANTFSMSRGDQPMASSGTIARCPPAKVVDDSVAH